MQNFKITPKKKSKLTNAPQQKKLLDISLHNYHQGMELFHQYKMTDALSYLEKAANGHPPAYLILGWLYSDESPLAEKDPKISQEYYAKAAQQIDWFQQRALTDDVEAQFYLGVCYQLGLGVGQDIGQAIYYYQESADNGHGLAQYHLGLHYFTNLANGSSAKYAFDYLKDAAKQQWVDAQFHLAECYLKGIGCEPNEKKAIKYYQLAANKGHRGALEKIMALQGSDEISNTKENAFSSAAVEDCKSPLALKHLPPEQMIKKNYLEQLKKYFAEKGTNYLGTSNSIGHSPLHIAGLYSNAEIFEYLLINLGANPYHLDASGDSVIDNIIFFHSSKPGYQQEKLNILLKKDNTLLPVEVQAACSGDLTTLRSCVENNPEILQKTYAKGNQLIHYAAACGQLEIIKWLLNQDKSIKIDLTNEDEQTPFSLATTQGHTEVVYYFVEVTSFELLTQQGKKNLVLYTLAENGHLELLQWHLQQCIEQNIDFNEDEQEKLFSSATHGGQLEITQWLWSYFIEPDINSFKRKQPLLIIATIEQDYEHINFFLTECYGDPLCCDSLLRTPLHYAVIAGNQWIIERLLAHPRHEPIKLCITIDKFGLTPVMLAITRKRNALFSFLLDAFPSIIELHTSVLHCNLLNISARYGNFEIFKQLIPYDFDINQLDKKGESTLSHAIQSDEISIIRYIVEDLKSRFTQAINRSALCLEAIKRGAYHAVRYFFDENSFLLEKPDEEGNTPVMLAAMNGNLNTVKYLVEQKAKLTVKNKYGAGIISQTAFMGHWEVIVYFKQYHHLELNETDNKGTTPFESALQAVYRVAKRENEGSSIDKLLTALNLLFITQDYNLKEIYQILYYANVSSQKAASLLEQTISKIDDKKDEQAIRKKNNLLKNYHNQMKATGTLAATVCRLQRNISNVFSLLLEKHSITNVIPAIDMNTNVFSCLPESVLYTEILLPIIKIRIIDFMMDEDYEDIMTFHNLSPYILTKLCQHEIQRIATLRQRHQKGPWQYYRTLAPNTTDEHDKEIISNMLTAHHSEYINYAKVYDDLLRIVNSKIKNKGINEILSDSCGSLFRQHTPLTAAIQLGFEKLVILLIEQGANVDQKDNLDQYPLHLACRKGFFTIVEHLCKQPLTSWKLKDGSGNTPLHSSILGGSVSIVSLLLDKYYDLELLEHQYKNIDYIPNIFFSLAAIDEYGFSPIELAIEKRQPKIATLLLTRGVDFENAKGRPNAITVGHFSEITSVRFKFKPFARSTENKDYRAQCIMVFSTYEEILLFNKNLETLLAQNTSSTFHMLRFLLLQFIENVSQLTLRPLIALQEIQCYLKQHSLSYGLNEKSMLNFLGLGKQLVNDLSKSSCDAAFHALEKEDEDINKPKYKSPFEKKPQSQPPLQTIHSTIKDSALFSDVVAVKQRRQEEKLSLLHCFQLIIKSIELIHDSLQLTLPETAADKISDSEDYQVDFSNDADNDENEEETRKKLYLMRYIQLLIQDIHYCITLITQSDVFNQNKPLVNTIDNSTIKKWLGKIESTLSSLRMDIRSICRQKDNLIEYTNKQLSLLEKIKPLVGTEFLLNFHGIILKLNQQEQKNNISLGGNPSILMPRRNPKGETENTTAAISSTTYLFPQPKTRSK